MAKKVLDGGGWRQTAPESLQAPLCGVPSGGSSKSRKYALQHVLTGLGLTRAPGAGTEFLTCGAAHETSALFSTERSP